MSYRRAGISLHSVAPDLIPQDAPEGVWNTCSNVLFRNGESVRVPGDTPTLAGASLTPRACVFMTGNAGKGYWLYATDDGIFAHDGTTEFDVTPAGWAQIHDDRTVWTACVLNGIGYINASDRDPVYWNGDPATLCQPLPDWPAGGRCLALRAHKSFLFAIGMISEGGQRVRWSDAAEVGTVPQFWTPAADNFAGFQDLSPLDSPCVDGLTLRDAFLVYKQESVWSFDFIGGLQVFSIRKVFAEVGMAATNCGTRGIDDVHLFVADEGDVMLTDGVTVRSVLDGRAQRGFYADFSANQTRVFSTITLAREKVAFVIYPSAGSTYGNTALIYDFTSSDIGFRDMPDVTCAAAGGVLTDISAVGLDWDSDGGSWDSDTSAWLGQTPTQSLDDVIIGSASGFAVVSDGETSDFLTGPVNASLSKSGLSMGDAQTRKLVARLWPKVTGRTGDTLQFRVGGQEITGGPITLSPPVTFTIGQDESIDTFVQGRFMSIEVTSSGGGVWRMGSLDIEYRGLGGW